MSETGIGHLCAICAVDNDILTRNACMWKTLLVGQSHKLNGGHFGCPFGLVGSFLFAPLLILLFYPCAYFESSEGVINGGDIDLVGLPVDTALFTLFSLITSLFSYVHI